MKLTRYTKFTGDLSSSFGLDDLMQALSDFLLDSGFQDPYAQFNEMNNQTMENLREAIRQALWNVHVKGVYGDIAFTKQGPAGKESGQNIPSVYLVTIKDGKVQKTSF